MAAVAVGGLHEHIVRFLNVGRVLDDGLVQVADIAGEDQLRGGLALGDPQLDAGRAQQVSHVHKACFDARGKLHPSLIRNAREQLHGRFGVLHGVHGLHRFRAGALALAVLPLGFKFLNVGGVPQHDAAQFHGGVGGINFAPEAVAHQQRQHTGMVDMGMGSQHPVDFPGSDRNGLIFVDILALLHAAVDQKAPPGGFDHGAAAGDLMVRAQKRDLHAKHLRF